jgi:two-component system response regulator YesN
MSLVFRRICPDTKDEVAACIGFSRSCMSRLFKERAGCRYIDYLTQLRMDKAKQMLATTGLPVKAVAGMAGYNSVAGFRSTFNAFKKSGV